MQSPESPMNRAFHGFWQQKRAGTKPAQVGADVHNGLETREKNLKNKNLNYANCVSRLSTGRGVRTSNLQPQYL